MTQAKKIVLNQQALPEGWIASTLGEVTSYIQRGKSPQYTTFSELPIVNQKCISWNGIDREHLKYIHPDQFEKWEEKRFLKNGDVLWNSTGTGTIGRAAIVHLMENERLVADSHVTIVRADNGLEPKYLHYWIMSPAVQNSIEAMQSGSTNQVELSKAAVESTPIPIAPPGQQKRIVAKIEELFSHIDAGIDALKKAKQLLKQYRQSVLKAAVTGELTKEWRETNKDKLEPASKLLERILQERRKKWEKQQIEGFKAKGKMPKDEKWKEKYSSSSKINSEELPELPNGWCWAKIEQMGTIQLGRQRAPKYHSGPNMRPYLRVQNVFEDKIDLDDVMEMDFPPSDFEKYKLEYNDILLNEGQSPELLGRPAIYRNELKDACFTNTLIRFQAVNGLLPEYALLVFRYCMHSGRFKKAGTITTNIGHLSASRFSQIEFPLCSILEQEEVLRVAEEKFLKIDRLEIEVDHQLIKAEKNKQTILVSAFSGKLVPEIITESPPATHALPKLIEGISETDVHAGVIALAIKAHSNHGKHANTLRHVKCEKIAHLVEAHLGISLGRSPYKDAAGPNDYKHLHKVDSRGKKAGWFEAKKLADGRYEYVAKPGIDKIVEKLKGKLDSNYEKVEKLIALMVPMRTDQAEILATLYAGWNNLLLDGTNPTDEEIVYESRENWHKDKLRIDRERFFKALQWMRQKGLTPSGQGRRVEKLIG